MASRHRVTGLETIPVRISKDEAPTQLSVVRAFFIFILFRPCYFILLEPCKVRFYFFSVFFVLFTLAFTTGSLPFIRCFILFSQFILVCFFICKNDFVLFCSL